MLYLDTHVPDALILPDYVSDLHAHLCDIGAHWFRMKPDFLDMAGASVEAVRSCTSGARARPSEPHEKNRFDNYDATALGLKYKSDEHCGYVTANVGSRGSMWSCAVRFDASGDDPRTLFTLNPDSVDNYVFLEQKAGRTTLKDQRNTLDLTVDAVGRETGSRLVVAGMSADRLWLRVQESSIGMTPAKSGIDLALPHNLFFGCRSNKKGLQKTLGSFVLQDVIFWPDRNVLEPDHAGTLQALDLPDLWEG
ncbi:MAG: hypothetical protein ABJ263_04500 [Tateyamaria sp.]|uniref:hypothetical protein n=1 Tax=Tateyamaria sp. TaxID=1929288 RepID=UPI00328A190A